MKKQKISPSLARQIYLMLDEMRSELTAISHQQVECHKKIETLCEVLVDMDIRIGITSPSYEHFSKESLERIAHRKGD